MGPLASFLKNGEIRPSLSYKIILEQREKRNQLNSRKEQQKVRELENVSLTFFKFKSIPTHTVSNQ